MSHMALSSIPGFYGPGKLVWHGIPIETMLYGAIAIRALVVPIILLGATFILLLCICCRSQPATRSEAAPTTTSSEMF